MNIFCSVKQQDRTLGASLIIFVTILLLGCQEATPPPTPTTSPTATSVVRTPVASPTSSPEAVEEEVGSLVLWAVEPISPEAEGEAGDFFGSSLRNFQRTNPDIDVEVILKKATGKGGVLDFLGTAKEVAPSVLPDVAIMAATELNQAYTAGLIQSLDGKLDRSINQDLLPAARRMGTVQDELVGVPLGLEMEHTVYNTSIFEEPPLVWRTVLTTGTRYIFPARGVNGLVNDLTLAQYFSAGGRLLDGEGSPTIDESVLRTILDFYQEGVENGTIDPTAVLQASTVQETWPLYLEGQAGIAQTSVRQYLTDRDTLNNTAFGPMPVQTAGETPVNIMHGWVLVLVTDSDNLEHQAAALSLIEWFLSTSNNSAWNRANNSIPTRDTAFQQVAGDDPYWAFLAEQLNTAQPQPGFIGYDQLGRIIQQAVVQVINGEATPDEAVDTAADALGQ